MGSTTMHQDPAASAPRSARARAPRPAPWRLSLASLAAGLLFTAPALAFEFGPFSLTGFVKAEIQRGSNNCELCQKEPGENRHRQWADALVYGKAYGTETSHSVLFQPYLGLKQRLGQGFTLEGLVSQRFRDGDVDIPGATYERNIGLSHEDYGSLRIGAMTSRSWSFTDYPFASDFGISDAWPSGGAGYALLGHAIRYQSRPLDVLEGSLTLEATYDTGPSGWQRNKPHLLEIWGLYTKGGLMISANYQWSRNGMPVAWGHAPFMGLTAYPADDRLLGGSGQSIVMVNARYYFTSQIEGTAGIRFNRWSGAYAVQTTFGPQGLWNSMFNVDWDGKDARGVPNPGYAARTTDAMVGVRWLQGPWSVHSGLVYLGRADTDNPSDRGQNNSALIGTVGVSYDFNNGLKVYTMGGMVQYERKGLAPLSMPSHNAFTNVDSRVAKNGNWIGVGALYQF